MTPEPCPIAFEVTQEGDERPFLRMTGEDLSISGHSTGCRAYTGVYEPHHAREIAQQLRGAADTLVAWAEAHERRAVTA